MDYTDNQLNTLFQYAKSQAPALSIEEVKTNFLSSGNSMPSNSSGINTLINSYKKLITTAFILIIATFICIVISNQKGEELTQKTLLPKEKKVQSAITPSLDTLKVKEDTFQVTKKETANKPVLPNNNVKIAIVVDKPVIKQKPKESYTKQSIHLTEENHQPLLIEEDSLGYQFPILTEEEKKEYTKLKSKMLKQLAKFDKNNYAYIPAGTTTIKKEKISIQGFYMQTNEVTVLEYRTFLFDLLMQNRKQEFIIAKPDQDKWMVEGRPFFEPMKEHYFSHAAYNIYPINNVSREAAQLYCKWLTEETNKTLAEKKNSTPVNDVRLPSNIEWMYAAKGGHEEALYPWGGKYFRNTEGEYLANFNPEGKAPGVDSAFFPAPVGTYIANDYGLYNMSGNIAEMVYYNDNTIGTKGGHWLSTDYFIQIEAEGELKGISEASPYIGFRPVIAYKEN